MWVHEEWVLLVLLLLCEYRWMCKCCCEIFFSHGDVAEFRARNDNYIPACRGTIGDGDVLAVIDLAGCQVLDKACRLENAHIGQDTVRDDQPGTCPGERTHQTTGVLQNVYSEGNMNFTNGALCCSD